MDVLSVHGAINALALGLLVGFGWAVGSWIAGRIFR